MARPVLSLAIQRFDRTSALHTGLVRTKDVMVVQVPPPVSVAGLLNGTFEAAEIPLAHYVFLRSIGAPFTAVPVFPDRLFLHQYIYTRTAAGVRTLADVRGRRVLVPMYFMTASFWHRALLKEKYGISPAEVEWCTTSKERDDRQRLPKNVGVTMIGGTHLGMDRLLAGMADCLMTEGTPFIPTDQAGQITRPFDDVDAIERAWFEATQFHPILHLIVIKQNIVDQWPEIVSELCDAFDSAKQSWYDVLRNERQTGLPFMRHYIKETIETFGADPWPYGTGNRNGMEIDRFLHYAHDQGLTEQRLTLNDLFGQEALRFPFQSRLSQ